MCGLRYLVGIGVLLGASLGVSAQERLSVPLIFGSGAFAAQELRGFQWSADGRAYYVLEPDRESGLAELWAVELATGARKRLVAAAQLEPEGEARRIRIWDYQLSPDGRRVLLYTDAQQVWRQFTKGKYYVFELDSGRLWPLSRQAGWQQFAKFSPDGRRIGFVREHNLFVVDVQTRQETQLTFDGSETVINGTFDWVYEEELDLRDGWRWSPDGEHIAFWRLDQSHVKVYHLLDNLGDYSQIKAIRYPKAGEENARVQIGVIELRTRAIRWMDLGSDPDIYIARMDWTPLPNTLYVQRLNRQQNRLELLFYDANTGQGRLILEERSPTWIDVHDELLFLPSRRAFLWASERTGWRHLYLYDLEGRLLRPLTQGEYEVFLAGVDERRGWVYYTSTEVSPLERHPFRTSLDGRLRPERLSTEPGTYGLSLSPTGEYYRITHSGFTRPPQSWLVRFDGRQRRLLYDNAALREDLTRYRMSQPVFFRFRTRDGVELNGWMIRPADFDSTRRYPVVMYVYGGPNSQTVRNAWGGANYLWHQMLANEEGFIVVSVDGRGTGARGRAFRDLIYRNLGHWEVHDQLEANRYLRSLPYVDSTRIGIWGWSYGGYVTALALTTTGRAFRCGIAGAPVLHWRFYDTIYTERYMDTPQRNPEGYARSAPLTHAERLEVPILIIHGDQDDNVHPQHSLQFIHRLQQLNKTFEFMYYPGQRHGVLGPQRVHLYTMMTDFFRRHLKTGS
ncbi:MAG: S9 family peptidase [Bacteroidetes bacterium]|nr:S9 family peptidase [Rhodothermia bacterium]MCS7154419.1 S9 family peptidase [Bacteroidota bacterium]MCX7906792.1 S9 family peptidase [Bacteroidota bacterium]MDW8136929.1 S9 family peptidase [Bacteroidota bacterium]MDW8285201.1 S9 family peptidase [Bacteroidota bacterium]